MTLAERYGPWAVVAGASEGLGAAFARQLAAAGCHLLLLARRAEVLEALATEVRAASRVEVMTAAVDLSSADLPARLAELLTGREIGVVVHNAAFAPLADFVSLPLESSLRAVDVNARAPLVLLHAVLPGMVQRKRGAVVLMSSLTAFQGSPYISVYGATKAFNLALAEGLWGELRGSGVDVLACCAGATRTPGYLKSRAEGGAPGELEPEVVVQQTLAALHKGPFLIPGAFNRFASLLMRRLLPRRTTIGIMAQQTGKLRSLPR